MSLQAILNAIATQATADADRILSEAESERNALIRKADALFESQKKKMLEEAHASVVRERELHAWECDKKRYALTASVYEEVLESAKEKAVAILLAESDIAQSSMIEMYVSNIPSVEEGLISVAPAHEKALVAALAKRSDIQISVATDASISGGFHVRTESYEFDATWSSVVARLLENNRAEYMSLLRS